MSIPESNYKLEDNKILVSLTLKIPLQFEIELRGMENTDVSQFERKKVSNQAKNINESFINNEINQAEIEKKVQLLSNQLATQILDNHNHILSEKNGNKFSSNNQGVREEKSRVLQENKSLNISDIKDKTETNQKTISTTNKNRKLRFADSLNDGLTLAANVVGTMLFMGKLANYSWE
ncbi:MAG: hypothetical protein AAF915_16380 [Cyanobacteria bacterium P01_D01_bin.50]